MKRTAGLVALGLGVFLVVMAPVLKWYVAPQVVRVPIDVDSVTVAEARGAMYPFFDEATSAVERRTGTIRATRQVISKEREEGTDHDRLVWEAYVVVQADSGETIIDGKTSDRLAIDRRTAEADNCCEPKVNEEPTPHRGLSYTFPIGTEKKDYEYFDTVVRQAKPISFERETTVNGLKVYLFEQQIEPEKYRTDEIPGALFGSEEPSVTADVYYENVRRIWVEPVTGAIVKGEEDQRRTVRDPDTGQELGVLLQADLIWTDDTIAKQVDDAKDSKNQALLVSTTGPLIALVAGLVIGVAGLVVSRNRRPDAGADQSGEDGGGGDGGDGGDEPTEEMRAPGPDSEDGRPFQHQT